MQFKLRLIPAAAVAFILAACGSGGGSSVTALSGVYVDGYLVGGTIYCDADAKGTASTSNVIDTTITGGKFTFSQGCSYPMIGIGGIDSWTGYTFRGQMRAPAGATVISPLTTLIADGVSESALKTALGLPQTVDLLHTDPALALATGEPSNVALQTRTLAVQQLMQTITERIAGLDAASTAADIQTIYAAVAKGFATALSGATPLVLVKADNTIDVAVLTTLANAAATEVLASTTVPAAVRTDLQLLTAANGTNNLMNASAASLAAAANDFLNKTSAADILVVSKNQQAPLVPATDVILIAVNNGSLTGATADVSSISNDAVAALTITPPAPASTNYLYLAADTLSYDNGLGAVAVPYTLTQFKASPGIAVKWPMANNAAINFTLTDAGTFSVAAGQTLTAAVEIADTAVGGQGLVKAYIDNVALTKSGTNVTVSVPSTALARVYARAADGSEVLSSFADTVAGVTNTLSTTGTVNSIVLGNVVNNALNRTGTISGLNNKTYKVTFVVTNLPLRQANGAPLTDLTVTVPSTIGGTSVSVTGPGLTGFITLTP